MDKDGIDASIGLNFSLGIFKRYRQSGVLQAEIPRIPGLRGRCKASLSLVNGEVVSVCLEDKQGQRHQSDKETLCRIDREKGPFEWTLIPQSTAHDQPPPPAPSAYEVQRTSIPKIVSVLTWDRLNAQIPQQREALYTLLTAINGERTVEDIKEAVPFPPELVDDLLRTLLELKVIVLSTK